VTLPRHPPTHLAELLERQDGVLTLSQSVELIGATATRWRLDTGRWQRPARAVLVAHSGPISARQRLWVHLLRAGPGAVLGGLSAAEVDGLAGFAPRCPCVLVPHGRQVRSPGIYVRSSTRLGERDVHPLRSPPRTRPPRSIVDAASTAESPARARAILAAGVQQRLVRVTDLVAVVDDHPRLPRRELIRASLADISGGSHSLPELEFLNLCRRCRLPLPDRQVARVDGQGRRRWLDAFFDAARLVVEIDGLWHMEAGAWWADMARSNALTVGGCSVLRYPSFVIHEEPVLVGAQIASFLERRSEFVRAAG
jgi:Protein of unknown function (DUF559)